MNLVTDSAHFQLFKDYLTRIFVHASINQVYYTETITLKPILYFN